MLFFTLACAHLESVLSKDPSSSEDPQSTPIDQASEESSEDPSHTEPLNEECDLEDGGSVLAFEGDFVPQGSSVSGVREACTQVIHAGAGAAGSTLSVRLDDWSADASARIQIEELSGGVLSEWVDVSVSEEIEVELSQSGEFFIRISSSDVYEAQNDYALSVDCVDGCELKYTRYPIFFMHGLAGFDAMLNVLNYWNGVEDVLLDAGYHVEIHGVSAFDTTVDRSVEWLAILEQLKEQGVARKFNLIAHSQGGLDARYLTVLAEDPSFIASITTIATPHYGTSIADLYTGVVSVSPFEGGIIDAIVELGSQLFGLSGDELTNQLAQMTTVQMSSFNQEVPNLPEIAYYSWSGASCRYAQFSCQSDRDGETVSSFFLLSHAYIEGLEGDNDGLVSVQTAVWGDHLGTINADHIDQVGHRFDLSTQVFDAPAFYRSEAERLFEAGF
ncbi:MAG: hypothetical protein CMK59_14725 [Proteobacteria bacterium]|nr:hypothetical protein [Pseudomonadota bacterium]